VKRSFKRARVEVGRSYQQYDAVLADVTSLSKQNLKFRFLLIVIDVISRFLLVEPVKDKTAKEILNAIRNIFKRGKIPHKLRTEANSIIDG